MAVRLLALSLLLSAATSAKGAGPNLITPNPDFDVPPGSPSSGWTYTAIIVLPGTDAHGCANSYSARLGSNGDNVATATSGCIVPPPGATTRVRFYAKAFFGTAFARVTILGFTANSDCTGPSFTASFGNAAVGSTLVAIDSGSLAINAASMKVVLSSSSSTQYSIDLDRAFFGDYTELFSEGFDASATGAICRWSAVQP